MCVKQQSCRRAEAVAMESNTGIVVARVVFFFFLTSSDFLVEMSSPDSLDAFVFMFLMI